MAFQGLFDSIRAVVQSSIYGDWVHLGLSIVDIVQNALGIPFELAYSLLSMLGFI
ncbi:beta-class phenol-soluble modulin [Erwinia sp. CPCC 100877]|nr:beta-class phenol-soluble modulin [Erwinia sp. CPCC 100877]